MGPAKEFGVKVLTRVVDYGGLFHDDVKPGHTFREGDHRTYRPAGWVEHGVEKIEKMRQVADRHGLTLLQFACQWNLAQEPVQCVVPTLSRSWRKYQSGRGQSHGDGPTSEENRLSPEEVEAVYHIGNNVGCMELKGASTRHEGARSPTGSLAIAARIG
ncbi:MAG: hypothetical protein R3F31_27345 [Verrucomicrobiales bacterium]